MAPALFQANRVGGDWLGFIDGPGFLAVYNDDAGAPVRSSVLQRFPPV